MLAHVLEIDNLALGFDCSPQSLGQRACRHLLIGLAMIFEPVADIRHRLENKLETGHIRVQIAVPVLRCRGCRAIFDSSSLSYLNPAISYACRTDAKRL